MTTLARALFLCLVVGLLPALRGQTPPPEQTPATPSTPSFLSEVGEAFGTSYTTARDAVLATGEKVPHLITAADLERTAARADITDKLMLGRDVLDAYQDDGALAAVETLVTTTAATYVENAVATYVTGVASASGNPLFASLVGFLAGKSAAFAVESVFENFFAMIAEWMKEAAALYGQLGAPPTSFDADLDALASAHLGHFDQVAGAPVTPGLQGVAAQLSAAAQAQQAQNQAALQATLATGAAALAEQVAASRAPATAPGLTSDRIPPNRAQLEREIADLNNVIAQLDENLRRQRAAGDPMPDITRQLQQNRATAVAERDRLVALRSRY